MGNIPVKLYLFGPVVQKEMSFKYKSVQKIDGLRRITIDHLEPKWTQVS